MKHLVSCEKTMARSIRIKPYTKEGYCLCEVMKAVVERDEALKARYGEEIPILFIEGRKAFKFRVSEQALRRKLDLYLFWRGAFGA
jgi:hypothetical protein